jgi:YD repeat-containing protein
VNASYVYDGQYYGTLTNVTAGSDSYKYEYDDRLRVVREVRTIDGIDFEKRSYYDSMGRLVKEMFSPGGNISYYYDAQGKIDRILNYVDNESYNAFGTPSNRTYANAKLTEFTYDSQNGRLTQIKTGTAQQLDYSYDAAGNVMSINDTVNGRMQTMAYDFLDRLTNATLAGFSYVYSYDPTGNMIRIVKDNTNVTKFVYDGPQAHAASEILTGIFGADVRNVSDIYGFDRMRIVGFEVANEKNASITNANWTIDIGNGTVVSSLTPMNLSTYESVFVILQQEYENAGAYNFNASAAFPAGVLDHENRSVVFGIGAGQLGVIYRNVTDTFFGFQITSSMNATSHNVSWNCSDGIASSVPFTLSGNETVEAIIENNYTSSGGASMECTANSTDGNGTAATSFMISGARIDAYNSTRIDENKRNVKFRITNDYYPAAVAWHVSSDGQEFSGTTGVLATGGAEDVSQDITYATDGTKTVYVNASAGGSVNLYNDTFTLHALRIEDVYSYPADYANRTINFTIRNYWPQAITVSWNISDPSYSQANFTTLAQGQAVNVSYTANYGTQGLKTPALWAYGSGFGGTYVDRFVEKLLEITSFMVGPASKGSTVFEIVAKNNIEPLNISWRLDTGEQNITSSQLTYLGTYEDVSIVVEANYTSAGIYPATAFVNSSSYNDTASGVAIVD